MFMVKRNIYIYIYNAVHRRSKRRWFEITNLYPHVESTIQKKSEKAIKTRRKYTAKADGSDGTKSHTNQLRQITYSVAVSLQHKYYTRGNSRYGYHHCLPDAACWPTECTQTYCPGVGNALSSLEILYCLYVLRANIRTKDGPWVLYSSYKASTECLSCTSDDTWFLFLGYLLLYFRTALYRIKKTVSPDWNL